jgi:hypothetical protein
MLDHLDPRIANNFIDANVLDHTGGPEAAAVDAILGLHRQEDHDFRLLLTYSVKAEIEHPHTPVHVKREARGLIFSEPVDLTDHELERYDKIHAMIQGNAKSGQHDKDAFHLFESAKYGRHFITNDQRLLRKANEIWGILQLRVLRPSEWLAAYKAHSGRKRLC